MEVRLNKLPSASDEPGWSDDVYVSIVSSIGPNPVDIIQWLIENYTEYSVDASNFASVKTKLAQYPSNFVVTTRPSVMKLVRDVAKQARMGVRLYNGVVSLIYLSEEPTSVRTLGVGDLSLGKFKYYYTETEDVLTNHVIKWREQSTPMIKGEDLDRSYSSRFNITRYGSSTLEEDYYTQNIFSGIYKSSTFWLIRKANTWLTVEFDTCLDHLDLDIMDCVTLNIPQFPTTKIVITEKTYNTETNTVTWKAWTPIRAGETTPYYWAWPSTKTSGIFPMADEREATIGDGSKKIVVPPLDHPLRVGYVEGESIPSNSGDPFPSDFGYVSPGISCQVPIGNEILYSADPLMDPLSRQSFQQEMSDKQNNAAGGGFSVSSPGREKKPCTFSGLNPCPPELSYPGDIGDKSPYCWYLLRVTYLLPDLIGTGCGGPCSQSKTNAVACSGQPFYVESVINGFDTATAAKAKHEALAAQLSCKANHGIPVPYFGATVTPYSENAPDCTELVDKSPPGLAFEPNINGLPEGTPTPGLSPGNYDPNNPPIPPEPA